MSEQQREKPGMCPVCNKAMTPDFRPFCSKHCADVDLGRWFSEAYAVPAVDAPDDDLDDVS